VLDPYPRLRHRSHGSLTACACAFGDHLAVHFDGALCGASPREMLEHALSTGFAHGAATLGLIEQLVDGLGQGSRVSRRHEHAAATVFTDDLGQRSAT
jgi:hypothetical protein